MRHVAVLLTLLAAGCSRESSSGPASSATAPTATAPATTSAKVTAAPAVLITPGKGIGPVTLGMSLAILERELGPCTKMKLDGKKRVCFYPHRGLDVGLVDNEVTRVAAHRGGRAVPSKEYADVTFAASAAATPEGVKPGMTKVDAESKLGPPKASGRPAGDAVGKDGVRRIAILEYPGMALDVEMVGTELVVGAIHVPKADAP